MKNKKSQANTINIIAGAIIIVGGISVMFNYVNLGLLLSGIGAVIETIKIILQGGLKG